MTETAPTAAIIIIGNEILSGRTQDVNTQWIAEKLTQHGIRLTEVRVVPDNKDIIIKTINELSQAVTYLFTTGGIGPTHDDITAESVAQAFGKQLVIDPAARQMLLDHYGHELELTEARLKMAQVPEGARLIKNPVSGAPGFIESNVYVMAGVPRIMQAMLDDVMSVLKSGPAIISNTVSCSLGESTIAHRLQEVQSNYSNVEIGSYPHYRGGMLGLNLVLRSIDAEALDKATQDVVTLIKDLGGEPGAISRQG